MLQLTCPTQLAAALLLACATTTASADDYPSRPIHLVTPYSTGITPDVATRLLADKLSRLWSKPVVVETKPGANGFLAFNAVKQAAPDGYTLLVVGDAHMTTNPKLLTAVPYDPQKDYTPVSLFFSAPFFLYTSASAPYASVGELVAAARKDAKKISYSTPYVGSPAHFGGAMLAQATGTEMLPIHYKEGAQMYTAVASGDVSFSMATIGSGLPLVKAGKMKILAVAAPQRLPDYPQVPTMRESGGPADMTVATWVGLVAPAGTPPEIVNKINAGILQVLNDPELIAKFRSVGIETAGSSPAAMATRIQQELADTDAKIKRYGIAIE